MTETTEDFVLVCYFIWHRDGAIVGTGCCPAELAPPLVGPSINPGPPGATFASIPADVSQAMGDPDRWWWNGQDVVPRELSPVAISTNTIAADGLEEVTISGIPAGTEISISGALVVPWTPVEGGSVTLTSTEPGRLSIRLRMPPPYLDWRGTVNAI